MKTDKQILQTKRLIDERTHLGMTQEQLAEKVGYTSPYISKLENGRKRITVEVASKLAAVFMVTPDYLLGYSDFRTAKDEMNEMEKRKKVELAKQDATINYLAKLGYTFRPCYVWKASVYATVMGYEIMRPYLKLELPRLHLLESFCTEISIDGKLETYETTRTDIEELINISKEVDYSRLLGDEYYYSSILDRVSDVSLCDIDFLNHKPLAVFELSENPLGNETFMREYYDSIDLSYKLKNRDSCDLDLYYIPSFVNKGYIHADLAGFLSGSSIDFRYAVFKNTAFKRYVSFEELTTLVSILNNSSIAIVDTMFK